METARVIQWTTGKIGKNALRGILDDPRLELVGLYAFSPDKMGQDAGAICDRPETGIIATQDIDALIALQADTILYTPYKADLDHLVRLLESGADVISTNLLSNIGGIEGETRDALEAACARGQSSLYITGINPGWLDDLAVKLTPICRRASSVSITESVSVAHYESADTWRNVGMSLSEATPEIIDRTRGQLLSFRDSVTRVAEALHFAIDDIQFFAEFATAKEDIDFGWFFIGKGTHAAIRAGWRGLIAGRTVVQLEVVWYMTRALNEDWALDADNYIIHIEGEPTIDARIRVTTPSKWSHGDHGIVTAMPAVNAVFDVAAAKPGILGLKEGGLVCLPAGFWTD